MSTFNSECLWNRWTTCAEVDPSREAIVHLRTEAEPFRWTWGALIESAKKYAAALAAEGIRPGDTCALIIRHHPQFYPLYLGVVASGAIPSVLAYPNSRIHPEKYVHGLSGMAQKSGLDWFVTERDIEAQIRPLVKDANSAVRGLIFPLEGYSDAGPGTVASATDPSAPCLLQHSSGTTGLQKAVMLSHRAILQHVDTYAEALELRPSDRIVSWLPFYHDMGMIAALHLALARRVPLIQLDPF